MVEGAVFFETIRQTRGIHAAKEADLPPSQVRICIISIALERALHPAYKGLA